MIDIRDIMEVLPHRYPFLLVDRIIELEPEKKVVAIKNVTINEPFFPGHFPGNPVMPGVLQVEAMAQAAGVLAFKSGVSGKAVYFLTIDKARFRKPVLPGDVLRMEIEVTHKRGSIWKFSGRAYVEDKVACEAEFSAMISEKEL